MKEATKNLKNSKFIKGFNPAIKQCHCISVKKKQTVKTHGSQRQRKTNIKLCYGIVRN